MLMVSDSVGSTRSRLTIERLLPSLKHEEVGHPDDAVIGTQYTA